MRVKGKHYGEYGEGRKGKDDGVGTNDGRPDKPLRVTTRVSLGVYLHTTYLFYLLSFSRSTRGTFGREREVT